MNIIHLIGLNSGRGQKYIFKRNNIWGNCALLCGRTTKKYDTQLFHKFVKIQTCYLESIKRSIIFWAEIHQALLSQFSLLAEFLI